MASWHTDGRGQKTPNNGIRNIYGQAGSWTWVFQVPRRGCWRGGSGVVGLGREDCQEQVKVLKWPQETKQSQQSEGTEDTQTTAMLYLISLDAPFAASQHQGMKDSYALTHQPHERFYDHNQLP